MNSLINKSCYILTLVSPLILLNGKTVFSQQNDISSSLITETISSVSSNLDSDYGPNYNLDNDSQVNSFLQELEISNELVYENLNQLGSVKEVLNIDGDNKEVFYEDSIDNQTTVRNYFEVFYNETFLVHLKARNAMQRSCVSFIFFATLITN